LPSATYFTDNSLVDRAVVHAETASGKSGAALMGMISPSLLVELVRLVEKRTHRRIQNLHVEVDQGSVILTGRAGSYHVKQLAQHGILDVMPKVRLVNAIEVWN
jgi:hypothetical protein